VADVLPLAVDSRGGVSAMIAIAGALRDDGVSTRIAACSDFGEQVRAAGVPSMAAPVSFDQPYRGRRLAELGVGERPVPYRKLTPARLAGAIGRLTGDPEVAARAKRLSAVLAAEDGPAVAAHAIAAALGAR
jgi:sterol 3beta-glucosyltransferase